MESPAEGWTGDLEERAVEVIKLQKEKKEEKASWRRLWNNTKYTSILSTGFLGERARAENLVQQIMAGTFPNLVKETDIQAQEAQRAPNEINLERPTVRHIIIKISKGNMGS